MKKKITVLTLGALLLALSSPASGAAADENPPDRIPRCYLPFRYRGPHRGFPAGSARAWVRGGEKHCH